MSFASGKTAEIVAGRECGKCSLCCKVIEIDEINKPPGAWCWDCAPGKGGCKIYETRPNSCRHFVCRWLLEPGLGDEWFPANAKLVVSLQYEGSRIAISVDPAFPNRWREQPFYSQIKKWAEIGAAVNAQVTVNIGKRVIVVLPNKEIDLGIVETGDHIMVGELKLPEGMPRDWKAWIRKPSDTPSGQA